MNISFYTLIVLLLVHLAPLSLDIENGSLPDKTHEKRSFSDFDDESVTPCEWLTVEQFNELFDPQSKVSTNNSKRTFPTCRYEWESTEEVEKEVGNRTISYQATNFLTIVLGSSEAKQSHFDRSVKVYKDGEDVALGEQAQWSEEMHQVTVLNKGYLIHVNVEFHDASGKNKTLALKVAQIIIDQLG